MLKNKIFTILLMTMLAIPAVAVPEFEDELSSPPLIPMSGETSENYSQEELPSLDTIPYKQPKSKRELAKRFLLGMGAVGASSAALFLILTLYNKVRKNIIDAAKEIPPEGETPLTTPETLTGAIKIFLEKTKWS